MSVLLPACNAERQTEQSVKSVLAQTHESFELLVVDDGSFAGIRAVLASIADPRLRILEVPRGTGVAAGLNRAAGQARGRYIARLDAGTVCLPTWLSRQKAILDRDPATVLVGSLMSLPGDGPSTLDADPAVMRWVLQIADPLASSATMVRAKTLDGLGCYLDEGLDQVASFDLLHRMLRQGDIAVVPERLAFPHPPHASRPAATVPILAGILRQTYDALLGAGCDEAALPVARHLLAGELLPDAQAWDHLRRMLDRLGTRFREALAPTPAQSAAATGFTGLVWDDLVRRHLRAGHGPAALRGAARPPRGVAPRARAALVPALVAGLLRPAAGPAVRAVPAAAPGRRARTHDITLNRVPLSAVQQEEDGPARLYVVVDTEAEFDWTGTVDREETRVSSAGQQAAAQAIFDEHGLRPIYVVDYAIASQPEGYLPLRAIMRDHRCVIGAHLHPWTTPPFEEEVSERNSFAGNLPPGLEEQKIRVLVAEIERNFGMRPLFYKSGRYGLSASTLDVLDRLGFQVDFSILPQADLRAKGGPDFRAAGNVSYRVPGTAVLSIPMSRGQTGLLSPVPSALHNMLHSPASVRMRLPGLLSRTGLLNTVTLTPEGMTVREQIGMLRAMARRGHRTFVLHYHSPSLGGFTPYVRNEQDLAAFVENIRAVCHFFMGAFGGMPGNPADLVPPGMRDMIWPRPSPGVPTEPALHQAGATRPG